MVILLALSGYDLSRPVLHVEERPVFSVANTHKGTVLISGIGGDVDGIHQFNDVFQLLNVIKLAGIALPACFREKLLSGDVLQPGKSISFQLVGRKVVAADLGWMSAKMRMALGIPLRVQRMNATDWVALPGVGPLLALKINEYRQRNGDFGSFLDLARVHGVGAKRLERWAEFFN
ncbi:ComEA family DNA-binding protein [Geopsychrobacter electrodiphilus]|uniref:ComEA family DNA-binding protein n=1 Tax=Geopsychrobacter electrodiphilus TaxID=225196 RepID=UPI00146AEA1E|nr:helix-hairpin-helix domain-containing protein [Geopsychrobacter electrodiphilus]